MQIKYKSSIGEFIWAMATCRPDIAFTSVKLSQSNSAPAEHHYHSLKHAIHYLYIMRNDSIYFWHTNLRYELPEGPLPTVTSNVHDLLMDDHPAHDAQTAVAYGDSDWASCVKTSRSSAVYAFNSQEEQLLTKQNFNLLLHSHPQKQNSWQHVMWEECAYLSIVSHGILKFLRKRQQWLTKITTGALQWEMHNSLQHGLAMSILNTLHCETGWNAIIVLEQIDMPINIADHLTKPLTQILFHHHADYLLGHIPPKYSPIY
jgi:hypothetical protein